MKRRGFTLIELLVVIAIIAILAAILFPVFAQAREKARQITCTSNLKQIGLGIMMYQQDYDETYPFNDWINGAVPIEEQWYNAIGPYVKNGQSYSYDAAYNGLGGVWSCPDEPLAQPQNYGINNELAPDGSGVWPAGSEGRNFGQPATLAQVVSPSDEIIVVEKGMNDGNASWPKFNAYQPLWTDAPGNGGAYPGFCALPPFGTASAANNFTYANHADINGVGGDGGDCDAPGAQDVNGATTPNWGSDFHGCGTMPRYRHGSKTITNMLFSDGHVKSMHKGQVNWYTNIYIAKPYAINVNNGFGNC
jgi:prepilin-type N-terminal cleavage/methylation domain-containing protein/prepilin-type processing-associated H-X9-DG protein